jgi:ribosomal protein L11 methyltransferase
MPFSQSKDTYKVYFQTYYKSIEMFEECFTDNLSSFSLCEVESKTVEPMPSDIWAIEAYLNKKPNFSLLKEQIWEFAKNNNLKILGEINLEIVEDTDWVALYQRQLQPTNVGRFFISSRIHKNICPADKIGIFIEAARAFGTGQHETTSGCIQALEGLSWLRPKSILDIGTGSGILSFAAEHIWPQAKIIGCDIEELSVEIARENAKLNNSNVTFYQNSVAEVLLSEYNNLKFDLIISNILANSLIQLSSEIKGMAEKGAYVVLSGFLNYQLTDVLSAYEDKGFQLEQTFVKDSWVILTIKTEEN